MKYLLLLFMFIPSICFAQAQDIRISDGDSHVLSCAGNVITIKTGVPTAGKTVGAQDIRISDNHGHVLTVNADGTVTAKF